jgi:HSP20 family protein
MTLVKFAPSKAFSLMEDFLNDLPKSFKDDFAGNATPFVPVNIMETKNAFQLEVVAPGLDKNDFNVSVEKNILTVSGEKKNEVKDENDKQVRKEYHFRSFKRSFTLDETINAEKIEATYTNGVLTLNLPKKEEVKTSKAIAVK